MSVDMVNKLAGKHVCFPSESDRLSDKLRAGMTLLQNEASDGIGYCELTELPVHG